MAQTTNQGTTNSELAAWLQARQSSLTITTTTTSPSGKTVDWVPIESQVEGPIATSPPASPDDATPTDPSRPAKPVTLDIGEPGPAGSVPILRPDLSKIAESMTLKDYLSKRGGLLPKAPQANSDLSDPDPQGYFHASSQQSATCYGCDAWLNVWDPRIDIPSSPGGDHSISQTWVLNNQATQRQTLEAGLTVDSVLNGDFGNHLFTFYTTNNYTQEGDNLGGYNRLQKGWVQVHPSIYPGILVNGSSIPGADQLELGIKFQLYEGNWWFGIKISESGSWVWLGYYPATLYAGGLRNVADEVSFGGEVESALSNPCSTQDQMGSGRHASAGWQYAAYQRNLRFQSNTSTVTMANYAGNPETDTAAANCKGNPYTVQCFMNSATNWGSYQFFGGPSTVGKAAAGSALTCLLAGSAGSRVYYLDTKYEVQELALSSSGAPTVSGQLASAAHGSSLTCVYVEEVGSRVYYLDSTNNIRELAWNSSSWNTSGPLAAAASGSSLTCLYVSDVGSRVYYLDSTHNVRELAWNGSSWNISGPLAAAAADSSLTCLYAGSAGSRVYYLDSTHNVRELAWNGSSWNTSGPLAAAAPGSSLTCLYVNDVGSRVYYLDSTHNVRELAWNGSGWNTSGPLAAAASGSSLTCVYVANVGSRVYYLDGDYDVCELAYNGSAWNVTKTGALSAAGDALTCLYVADSGSRTYYLAPDSSLHEVAWTSGNWSVF